MSRQEIKAKWSIISSTTPKSLKISETIPTIREFDMLNHRPADYQTNYLRTTDTLRKMTMYANQGI